MLFIILLTLIVLLCIYKSKEKNIDKFFSELETEKNRYIEKTSIQRLKYNYKNTFEIFKKIPYKTKKVKQFFDTYSNLDEVVSDFNKEFLEIEEKKKAYTLNLAGSNEFLEKIKLYRKDYFSTSTRDALLKDYEFFYNYFSDEKFLKTKCQMPTEFMETYRNLSSLVNLWNESFINNELHIYEKFFDNVDGKKLDEQQRIAVITNDTNNLILAGAGSGKTLTIAAKVKYLVKCKNILPEEILLISFTKKAAEEMTNRITKELKVPITAVTFHKLGYNILGLSTSSVSDDLNSIISSYFKDYIINDESAIKEILEFFLYYLNVPMDLDDFETLGEYIDNQTNDLGTLKSKYEKAMLDTKIKDMRHDLVSIKKEKLKSIEEVMIANFLFMNGVNYEYEKEYPYKEKEKPDKKYHPDFYLTDYDIYLEHFGINENKKLPWLSEIEEKRYLKDMEWKRQWHQINGTKLIETFSYYNKNHELISKLKELLVENGVKLSPINFKDIYKKVYADNEDYNFKEFEKLIQTFIQLFKANGYSEDDFSLLNTKSNDKFQNERNSAFIKIVKPIFEFYQKNLKTQNKIDYNDMINLATKEVQKNGLTQNYKYIIIDEYQDISFGRYKLIKEIITKTHAKLFCVGDDWQSIYRFSGSDLTLFTNFPKYFGETKLLKIEKTYRNSQELLDIAKRFVEMNPEQLSKNLKSDKRTKDPIVAMVYSSNQINALHNALTDIKNNFGDDAQVLLLGRTKFDINQYLSEYLIYNAETEETYYRYYPKMKIKFLTVHSSKGLEADNVIILNMANTLLGFPNKISDDPVLSLVLQNKDGYQYAEERRLFYVAITRTKNKTYLIVPDRKQSVFYKDLCKITNLKICINQNEDTIINHPLCPKCKGGTLELKEKDGKKFIGCSNYPYCNFSTSSTEVLVDTKYCPKCGGLMVKRKGKYGTFWGCSNYRTDYEDIGASCNYTEDIKW